MNKKGRYIPALVLSSVVLPLPNLAVLITLAFYASPSPAAFPRPDNPHPVVQILNRLGLVELLQWLGPNNTVLLLGLIITLLIWLLFALPCQRFATAQGGNPLAYERLQRALDALRARKKELDAAKPDGDEEAQKITLADIETNLTHAEKMLQRNGLQWISGTGYTALWSRINIAEEAMIDLLPTRIILADAKYDELRLQGADIPDKTLSGLLHDAIGTLRSPKPQSNQDGNVQRDHDQAIAAIGKVRCILHHYNNERWEALVRGRNFLTGTSFFIGLFTYTLLALAIIAKIPAPMILNASVFYLLGAIIGLFNRLYKEWQGTDPIIDDYGLTMARILVTPLLSGLAALVGVFLVVILSITLVTPITGSSATSTHVDLTAIYNIQMYPQNLVFAAVFGLVPSLVITILQQKAEDIKSQIKSTSVADQGNGSSSSNSTAGSSSNPAGANGSSNPAGANGSSNPAGGNSNPTGTGSGSNPAGADSRSNQ
jgi:hypothetical protein